MLIINGLYPPNFKEILKYVSPRDEAVFCFGDFLYNPKSVPVDKPLMEHERVHSRQQFIYGMDKLLMKYLPAKIRINNWWHRYLKNPNFRLAMEIPAYQIQFQCYKEIIKARNKRFDLLKKMAQDLSGETYGKCITFSEAMKAIEGETLYDFRV